MPTELRRKIYETDETRSAMPDKLRIVSGKYRRRTIRIPKGVSVRPTTDRMRERLFAVLEPHIVGAQVLDLYSGTGICSLEALSRGAQFVECVEQNQALNRAIRDSIHELDCAATTRVTQADVVKWLRRTQSKETSQPKWDIVLIDPPYDNEALYRQTLRLLAYHRRVDDNTIISLEGTKHTHELIDAKLWNITRTLSFSQNCCMLLQKKPEDSADKLPTLLPDESPDELPDKLPDS